MLDALGVIPGEGNVLGAVQLGAGIVSGGISAANNDLPGVGLAGAGNALTMAGAAGARLVVNGVKVIPIAGNIVSGISVLYDVFGKEGLVAAYKGCMSGTQHD